MRNALKVAVILTASLLYGCDKRLDIIPQGYIILSSVSEYSALLDNPSCLLYDNQMAWNTSFDGGLMSSLVTSNSFMLTKINHLGLLDMDRTTDFKTSELYKRCYERIARYNIIIENVMNADGTDAERLKARAEAQVLRAYNHFVLVNIFSKHYNPKSANTDGGILLKKVFSLEEKTKQSSVAEVYQFVEYDINSALPHLQAKGKNVNHPGLAFAYALLAKVHLFKQEFDKAEAAAKESLKNNSYIFDWVAWDLGPKPAPEIGYNNEENLYFGYGINDFPPSGAIGPRLVQKYTAGDLRKERLFWDSPSYLLPGCYAFKTYKDQEVTGAGAYRTVRFNEGGMKVSEVVLMLAECYARAGKIEDAMQLVNNLRKKRILPDSYVDLTASDKREAFNHVMDERSRELVLTHNNFYDIRRLEVEGIHQSVDRILPDGSVYTVNSSAHIFTMPFPQDAIDRSGTLKQNVEK